MRGEFIDVNGVRMYYYAAGTRGAGAPLLLVHGFATSGYLWQHVVPLVPPGYRTIVVDIAGHGRSEAPARAPTVAEHASLIAGLLVALRVERTHVAAHGLGCEIALALARIQPSLVVSLLLANASASSDRPAAVPNRFSALHAAAAAGMVRTANYLLTRKLVGGYVDRERGARTLARHLDRYQSSEDVRALASHIRVLARETVLSLPRTAPIAVVHGADDPFVDAGRLRSRFAGVKELLELPGERHFLPEEAPETVAAMLTSLLHA